MNLVRQLAYLVVFLFFIILIGRLVLDWIQVFARDWRPRGPMLVVAELIYTVTDPPLRALRRILPPLRIGRTQLDLAYLVLSVACVILLSLLG